LLTGILSETDKSICSHRNVLALELPVKIRDLCETIDRLGWPAHEYVPQSVSPKVKRAGANPRSAKSRKRG